MRKTRVFMLALLCLTALGAGGCRARNVTSGMAEGEAYDAVITVHGRTEAAREEEAGLGDLIALLGKTDEEAAGLLGGGEENRTADESHLVGRIYRTALFGTACSVYTSYGENGAVEMAVIRFETDDAQGCKQEMERLLGDGTPMPEEEMPEGGQGWRWSVEGIGLTLCGAGDSVSLDISGGAGPES